MTLAKLLERGQPRSGRCSGRGVQLGNEARTTPIQDDDGGSGLQAYQRDPSNRLTHKHKAGIAEARHSGKSKQFQSDATAFWHSSASTYIIPSTLYNMDEQYESGSPQQSFTDADQDIELSHNVHAELKQVKISFCRSS